MTENNLKVNKNWTSELAEAKKLTKITGTLTSQIQLRDENKESYYYVFVKLKNQTVDLPVIFKVKCLSHKVKHEN